MACLALRRVVSDGDPSPRRPRRRTPRREEGEEAERAATEAESVALFARTLSEPPPVLSPIQPALVSAAAVGQPLNRDLTLSSSANRPRAARADRPRGEAF